ncbi:MAG TPA: hypothetical protein DIW64_07270 [Cellvibrio sp.]|nr:hypothetical protein [Cellvibrio sp.]
MIVIGSLVILLLPLVIAFVITLYCWRQGWSARIVLILCAALISLHTHAHYFPSTPLKERYANIMLKNQPAE